jgi:hypothetical protein
VETEARQKTEDIDLPIDFPSNWHRWPLGIEVSFTLTESNGVNGSMYKHFKVLSLQAALENLLDSIHTGKYDFVGYRFFTLAANPEFDWYVTWPVRRRGSMDQICRAEDRVGAAPWDRHAENTLFQIFNKPRQPYGTDHTLMLRTGGWSKAEATQNWEACSKSLRKLLGQFGTYPSGFSPAVLHHLASKYPAPTNFSS